MSTTLHTIRQSLLSKFILSMGLTLIVSISAWTYLNYAYMEKIVNQVGLYREVLLFQKWLLVLAILVFVLTAAVILFLVYRFVHRPIKLLIKGTQFIARGKYATRIHIDQKDEMGQLATAINQMGKEIGEKQTELNKQRAEYQTMFELVPCIITVQDRNYKLIKYNREFAEKFDPKPGDFCYYAYKGRSEKCPVCPVEQTFEDGRSHYSEETGFNKDGSVAHWIVNTSPIKNEKGVIVAVIEMNLDITHRKLLEEKLEKSEKKYYAIFNNIPNPVFVLDVDSLEILDCNESVKFVYGFPKSAIIRKSFLELFQEDEKEMYAAKIKTSAFINRVKHLDDKGRALYVHIRVSPSEYPGQKVLLVTTSDITKIFEAERQLIHASKMATLGEMSTGVAHELNQPLSVIKTASNYFMRKISKNEKIDDETLFTMSKEIDSYVDRATNIINHMRQFGRKSDLTMEPVQVNDLLKNAFQIFSQQLKLREIEVVWTIEKDLPEIMADPGRLEQVFINLLINARDAIEDRWHNQKTGKDDKCITLKTVSEGKTVIIEVRDTGTGIPESISDKIFEPFFTTKKVGQGTGLGLSISYGIIKDCGGSIQALSGKEGGARFIIKFPIPDPPKS
ncbi:MAG: PAS domain S-box protein [Desulfobacterales bacterium]|nr:PAS domain S-box protein [Desulfobacterales bacterium]